MFHPIRCVVAMAIGALLTLPLSGQTLDGEWSATSGTMDGQLVPANALASMKLSINSTNFSAVSGSLTSSGTLGQNTTTTPAQLVFNIENGADKGNKINAIYKFSNENLTITFSKSADGSVPTGFDSTTANKFLQLVYRKVGNAGDSTAAANPNSPGQDPNAVDAGVTGGAGGGASSVFK